MTYADQLAEQRMIQTAVADAAQDKTVQIMADIKAQRILWLHIVSMCEAFGVGERRLVEKYFATVDKNAEELEVLKRKHGEEYALDKLRQRAAQVSGLPVEYLYEKEILAAKERNEAKGIYFPALGTQEEPE